MFFFFLQFTEFDNGFFVVAVVFVVILKLIGLFFFLTILLNGVIISSNLA